MGKGKRSLSEIIAAMELIAGPLDKYSAPDEGNHQDADELLIEALRRIALTPVQEKAIERLIAAYEHIGKWYA